MKHLLRQSSKKVGEPSIAGLVRKLRWIMVFGIFAFVIGYQWVRESLLDFGSGERVAYDILLYAFFGSLVTWFALTWVSNKVAAGERAEHKAREEEKYIASIAASSADAILSMDPEGTITSWNKGAEVIFGYTDEEIIGQNISILVPADLLGDGELERLAAEINAKGFVKSYETERLSKKGNRLPVSVTQTALADSQGNVTGYSKIVRDITERKAAEKWKAEAFEKTRKAEQEIRQMNIELEKKITERTESLSHAYEDLQRVNEELRNANEQLQELDRMKSEFVSMVSHALRAPITNINGAIELLSQVEGLPKDSEQKEYFDIIESESARLTRLVRGVLAVSRLEGGRLNIKRESIDVCALAEKTVHRIRTTTENHSFTIVCPKKDLPFASADAEYTEEVLSCLIDNAVKYSPEGGDINITLNTKDTYILISVIDKGIGLTRKDLDRIFERFYRVDGSDSGAVAGYGLGLYISKRLVEAMGGKMEAQSTLGEGSAFRFYLPMA